MKAYVSHSGDWEVLVHAKSATKAKMLVYEAYDYQLEYLEINVRRAPEYDGKKGWEKNEI